MRPGFWACASLHRKRQPSLSSNPTTSAALKQQFIDAQAAGKIFDYEKEIYGNTGFTRNSVLSITGGNDKTSFYFSAAQKKEDGIVDGTGIP